MKRVVVGAAAVAAVGEWDDDGDDDAGDGTTSFAEVAAGDADFFEAEAARGFRAQDEARALCKLFFAPSVTTSAAAAESSPSTTAGGGSSGGRRKRRRSSSGGGG